MTRISVPASGLAGERAAERRWWFSLLIFVLFGVLGAIRYSGPTYLDRRDDGISGSRAMGTLDRLLGDEQNSHPAGSPENERVRIRLLGALDELGARTWQLPLLAPDRAGMVNIIARIDGEARARPLVLATHYDSSPVGPGAGDAGQCVAAILETVKTLKSQPAKYELWCLFTDAEERGMWGADELTQRTDLPWGDAKPLVINFDARGDRGAALLYETHIDNLHAMRLAASALSPPKVSTSLMVNIYQRLPNGTDFTPFRKNDWHGWNFAVIDGAERYHTANDTLENLSPRSLHHFASHAISFIRHIDALSDDDLISMGDSEPAVFFDVLGFALIVYPTTWNTWQLSAMSLMWLLSWFISRQRMRPSRVVTVMMLMAAALALSGASGWAITQGLKLADMLPRRYVDYGDWICLAFPTAAGLVVIALARVLGTRYTRVEIFSGLVLFFALVGGLATLRFPGGAYLLLVPGCVLVVMLLLDVRGSLPKPVGDSLGSIACFVPALFYAPTYVLLAQALGPTYGALIATGASLMLLPTLLAWATPTLASRHGS